MKIKIAFVIQSLDVGGSSALVANLVKRFSKSDDYDVYLISFFDIIHAKYKSELDGNDFKMIFLHKKKTIDFDFNKLLKRTIKSISPDIISAHLTCVFYLETLCNLKHAKVFHTIHARPDLDLPWVYRLFLNQKIRRGEIRLIGISDKITLLASNVYDIDAGKIVTIYNGVELPDATATSVKKKYDFLFVGRFVTIKHVCDLIKTFEKVCANRPNALLAICGYGEDGVNIKNAIDHSLYKNSISLFNETTDVKDLYLSSKCFCLFSETEGNPIVILEAMSYGLPIIATNVGGITDVVIDGKTGYLFTPGDYSSAEKAMTLLIDDLNLFSSFSQNALDMIANFSIERTFEQYNNLFLNNYGK